MALDPEEIGIELEQVFTDDTPTLPSPILRTVLIGEHFQIETDLAFGTYAGSSVVASYPELKVGAVPINAEVAVKVVTSAFGTFSLVNATEFTPTASNVTVNASLARTITLLESITGKSYAAPLPNTANFQDLSANFITDGVLAGDTLTIAAPSANAGARTITAVIDQNHLVLAAPVLVDATAEPYAITGSRALSGSMLISYRAQRNDLVGVLQLIETATDVADQAGPPSTLNPLGLGAALYQQASPGTAFFITGLASGTLPSHAQILDELEDQPVYVLVPLQQNNADLDITDLYKAHVSAESEPGNNKFRIALVSRDVPTSILKVTSRDADAPEGMDTGPGVNEMTITDTNTDFLADEVSVGDVLTVTASTVPAAVGSYIVKAVNVNSVVLIGTVAGAFPADVTYSISSPAFSLADQAQYMHDYAQSIACRRIVNLVAGRGEITTSLTGSTWIPSFYANAILAALVSTLPSQQGLSRFDMPGITGIRNPALGKFRRSDLNTIGSGGNLILERPTEADSVRIRRQNTTDKSTADTAELSITKNLDYVSFVYLGALEPFLGVTNLVPSFFSRAKVVLDSVRSNLTSNDISGIGPTLLSAELFKFGTTAVKGELEVIVDVQQPFPTNKIRLTLRAS